MKWIILCAVAALCWISAIVSYDANYQRQWWYLPLGVFIGASVALCWCLSVRIIGESQAIYRYSFIFDALMAAVYALVPILYMGVKLDARTIVGGVLITAGAFFLK